MQWTPAGTTGGVLVSENIAQRLTDRWKCYSTRLGVLLTAAVEPRRGRLHRRRAGEEA
jgi:hypothetical protein